MRLEIPDHLTFNTVEDTLALELLAELSKPLCQDCLDLLPTDKVVFWVNGPPRCEAHR